LRYLCIRAALEARGDPREVVWCRKRAWHQPGDRRPSPAIGSRISRPNEAGRVDLDALKARLGPDVAGVMITNPNTCGLFEPDMIAISEAVHAAGGFVYCDGANFNAIVGKVRPGDLGIDAMHINLHKTFSTPHGGGGRALGRSSCRRRSRRSAAAFVAQIADGTSSWSRRRCAGEHPRRFGRMVAFHGQMGMFTRALTYILSHGATASPGCRGQRAQRQLHPAQLEDVLDAPFAQSGRACTRRSSATGLCEGFSHHRRRQGADRRGLPPDDHVFPAGRHGAMLVEPTETESKASLDQFIAALRSMPSGRGRGMRV
jgi:glycine dehydrogenase subunit 2